MEVDSHKCLEGGGMGLYKSRHYGQKSRTNSHNHEVYLMISTAFSEKQSVLFASVTIHLTATCATVTISPFRALSKKERQVLLAITLS